MTAASPTAIALTPPMGWNYWNAFGTKATEADIYAAADVMVSCGMREAGYEYVNIDDGWQGERDLRGVLYPNDNFRDIQALADYVHARGLKLGLYSSPSPTTCAGFAGSGGYEEQDARLFAGWGVDYLKYDWCGAQPLYSYTRPGEQVAFGKMGAALRRTGRPIVYSISNGGVMDVWEWAAGLGVHLWRTSGDIKDNWDSFVKIGFAQNGLEKFAGPGRWNDPDMLEVGNSGMTETEYQTQFSLWCLLSAPLISGTNLPKMSPRALAILTNKEAIAVNQDPLGVQARRVFQDRDCEVWGKRLWDGGQAVGLFNRGDAPAEIAACWSDLGLTGLRPVRELWDHEDKGLFAAAYRAHVPAHGAALLRVG